MIKKKKNWWLDVKFIPEDDMEYVFDADHVEIKEQVFRNWLWLCCYTGFWAVFFIPLLWFSELLYMVMVFCAYFYYKHEQTYYLSKFYAENLSKAFILQHRDDLVVKKAKK